MIEAYKKYKAEGLACLPTGPDKMPAIPKGSSWKGGWNNLSEYETSHGIAIICGKSSGNLECIDFDNSFGDIGKIFKAFLEIDDVQEITRKYYFPAKLTKRKGFHLLYRCDIIEGNQKLAARLNNDGKKEVLIETRGEGGYFCVEPTPGYKVFKHDILNPPVITAEEREILLSACKSFNEVCTNYKKPELEETDRPGDIYNKSFNAVDDMKASLTGASWKELSEGIWRRPGKDKGISATLGKAHPGIFYNFSSNGHPFENDHGYTAFQVVGLLKYNGDFKTFAKELYEEQNPSREKKTNENSQDTPKTQDGEYCPYIRVGVDYFKVINKKDRYGIERRELKRWTKDALITDFKRGYLKTIPKYDDFVQVPDNQNYQGVINNCYNMYAPFCHTPAPGEWTWTKILLEQVFGEQYEYGMRYMQILYCYPQRPAPILVLVSSRQKTGKTTFVNWISMLFGSNAAQINAGDFQSMFNGQYATKNIVMIEETLFDKKITIERLKAIATAKQISVNRKNIDQFNLDYFGKIILTSNFEDKFAQISTEETRFFVRKLGEPKLKRNTIECDLLIEIPAFLDYLATLPPVSNEVDRSGFTSEELRNEFLDAVKEESKHETSKELKLMFAEYFDNHENITEFYASATDIKTKFFVYDNRTGLAWLLRVLKDDFGLNPGKLQKYIPFGDITGVYKAGRPYIFNRNNFTKDKIDEIPF